jgi:hypothetical protein
MSQTTSSMSAMKEKIQTFYIHKHSVVSGIGLMIDDEMKREKPRILP